MSGSKCCKICFSLRFIPLKCFLINLEPVLHCNHLTNAFKNFHQNLGMSCDVPTSLLCKNTSWPLEILSSTPTFPIWSSGHFCTTTHLNISLKILPSVWRCQWMHTIHLQAKTQWCSLKNLSESTSFSFWPSLVIWTATLFYFAPMPMTFFLLLTLPSKPLSPGEWTHWRIVSACNKPFFFLSKTGVLQNLH